MNSKAESSFSQLYLKRFLRALNRLKKSINGDHQGDGDEVAEVVRSSRNIKVAADVSLALTANRAAWSRGLLSRISSDVKNKHALRKIFGPKKFREITAQRARYQARFILQSKLKQAHMHYHKTSHGLRGRQTLSLYRLFSSNRFELANRANARLVNSRIRQLQRVVPGGKSMEASCLLRETVHYITSVTTQVEVLQFLVNSMNNNQHPRP